MTIPDVHEIFIENPNAIVLGAAPGVARRNAFVDN